MEFSSAYCVGSQVPMSVQNVSQTLWILSGEKFVNIRHFRVTLLAIKHLCKFGKLNVYCTEQET